jgi:DNA-binding response OmpR family regulator
MNSYTKKLTAFYLEDDLGIRDEVNDFLELFFDKVYLFDNGLSALNSFKSLKPDILLLDINTPIMNGIELAQQVRNVNKDIPIIFLTARSEDVTMISAIDVKASGYLIKPFDFIQMKDKILSVVNDIEDKSFINLSFDFKLNIKTKELFYKSKKIDITTKEKDIIVALFENKGRFLKAIDIHNIIASKYSANQENNIVKIISRLKQKLKDNIQTDKFFIQTKYGQGYKYC